MKCSGEIIRTAAVRAREAPLLKNVAMHFVERRPG
jgi:hypothetical protein